MNPELARQLFLEADYPQALYRYEQALQEQPNDPTLYAYLGLAYLLSGDESAAQLVWFNGLMEIQDEISEQWLQTFVSILSTEALNKEDSQEYEISWLIRQHIRELIPGNIENILYAIRLTIKLEEFHAYLLNDWKVVEILRNNTDEISNSLIKSTLSEVLKFPAEKSIDFAEACLGYFTISSDWASILIASAKEIAFKHKLSNFAAMVTELCLKHLPDCEEAHSYITWFYIEGEQFNKAVQAAYSYYERCRDRSLEVRLYSHSLLLKSLLSAGQWSNVIPFEDIHKNLLKSLFQEQSTSLTLATLRNLMVTTGQIAYLRDDLPENRWFQNQAAQLTLNNLYANAPEALKSVKIRKRQEGQRLRIGYIGSTLRKHSVGWLCRWLFQSHNRNAFEISLYLVAQRPEDTFFADWFAPYVDHYTFLDNDIVTAANTIRHDEVDILIDLDSVTSDITPIILALKPAPIQVTWLGSDASGLSTIDYFIADPYVLEEKAQECYQEKIWRLPQTYVAVNGFEIGVATLRRSDLNIPDNAIVYFSSQGASKRHPDTFKLQLQILKEVPNSIFLIKGLADKHILEEYVTSLAEEVGVSIEKFRFLDWMSTEIEHRANLQIADIVLDTYPYNGATTTLETLWLGIPLVTRVGSTFSARNSYAFMMNVGITEGIAWTDEEYIEWGIRFGKDERLRQQVVWKLKQSRHTSPLWNAKQFTLDMENAYHKMWDIYTETKVLKSR